MLMNTRAFGIYIAVICFFCVGIVGWAVGLSAYLCCKRALTAALFGYVAGVLIERVLYVIIYDRLGNENKQEVSEAEILGHQREVN
ncbi:MAG: hypothetical protein E4H40_06005 [Candidatus Brocadiia bacterium]|nr:MAG: hypothetical protein E4H40_06005 [Candidatus Brocadiia bacterium]